MLGQDYTFNPTRQLARDILDARGIVEAVMGNTMGTDDFYEGQGRKDGALKPPFTRKDRMVFLHKAHVFC